MTPRNLKDIRKSFREIYYLKMATVLLLYIGTYLPKCKASYLTTSN